MNQPHKLLLKNIKQVFTANNKELYVKAQGCSSIEPSRNISIAIDDKGKISKIGPANQVEEWINQHNITFSNTKDCSKVIAIPGLVDAHTHALFAGNRSKQFDMKLNGCTYVDIYNQGLGIRYTTEQIRQSLLQDLVTHLQKYVHRMNKLGTTTVQIKSGYGLNAEAEVKMLRAIEIVKKKFLGKMDIISTFCGAHAIPKDKTEEQQTLDVIQNQIPAVRSAILCGDINPKFIDVFCERKFFQRKSSVQIMKAGKQIGLTPSFHGDELSNLQSGEIAVEVGALAVSHLQYLSENSVKLMAENNVAGLLLPTTQNIEKLPVPPIKLMRQYNMILALGSDFCPNAHCYNMSLVCHLACTNYRLTPKQSILAATINSAYALGLSQSVGSLQQGKKGDVVLLDAPDWVCFMYHFGDAPIQAVIKEGNIIS